MAEEPVVIDDMYQVRSTIAAGNKTIVHEVVENGTGRHLAMKLVIEGKPEPTKEAKADLKAEAAVAKTLMHPNIVRFEKYSTSRDATYILMEFFRAANLKAQIKSELVGLHGRARPVLEGVCQALIYLHEEGWVHRDLKPENILANRAGEAKLVDFSLSVKYSQGIGKMLGFGAKKTIQGTRTYIAPETILRKAPSPQTDIYSLGITFFEILTGKTPFQGFTPEDLLQKHLRMPPPLASALNPNLTPEVDQLLINMLAKKPKDRLGSMQEVFGEIRRIKLFVKDAAQLQADEVEAAHQEKMSIAAKLDSRTDAERSELLRANPHLAEQYEVERKQRAERRRPKRRLASKDLAEPAPKPAAPVQPAQQPMPNPFMMQQPMMPQPMMMPMPHPGMAMPPGMPYLPPGMMPGMAQPAVMPFPQAPFAAPPQGMPQIPAPPSAPISAAPPPSPPSAPAPAAPAAPAAPNPDALEYMTELPNVL